MSDFLECALGSIPAAMRLNPLVPARISLLSYSLHATGRKRASPGEQKPDSSL